MTFENTESSTMQRMVTKFKTGKLYRRAQLQKAVATNMTLMELISERFGWKIDEVY